MLRSSWRTSEKAARGAAISLMIHDSQTRAIRAATHKKTAPEAPFRTCAEARQCKLIA
jgi:hypothetical protein